MAPANSLGHQPLAKRSVVALSLRPRSKSHRCNALIVRDNACSRPVAALGGPRSRGRQLELQVFASTTDLSLVEAREALPCRVGSVRYRFVVPQYVTKYGQSLRVVGSLPELGSWDPSKAALMSWSDGHQWSLDCELPQQSFEFKVIVFEGHGVRWEGGSNRVVLAEGQGGDVPVEIVVWLTCHFNATAATQMQLAVPRARVQDAYETGKATLEFLRRRKSKLGQDTDQSGSPANRQQQAAELVRLSEAVAEHSTALHQLEDLLGAAASSSSSSGNGNGNGNGNGSSALKGSSALAAAAAADDEVLLLAIDSVRLPQALRRISFANVVEAWSAGTAALEAGVAVGGSEGQAAVAPGPPSLPSRSPFLLGELDSRAEELMSAAGELLRTSEASQEPDPPTPPNSPSTSTAASTSASPSAAFTPPSPAAAPSPASLEWASLAEEAGHVAGALAALRGGSAATQLQLQGLASVGSALAGGGGGAGVTAAVPEGAETVAASAAAAAADDDEGSGMEDGVEGAVSSVVEPAADMHVHHGLEDETAAGIPAGFAGGDGDGVETPLQAAEQPGGYVGLREAEPELAAAGSWQEAMAAALLVQALADSDGGLEGAGQELQAPSSSSSGSGGNGFRGSASTGAVEVLAAPPPMPLEPALEPALPMAEAAAEVVQVAGAEVVLEWAEAAPVPANSAASTTRRSGAEREWGDGGAELGASGAVEADRGSLEALKPASEPSSNKWGILKLMSQIRSFLDSLFL